MIYIIDTDFGYIQDIKTVLTYTTGTKAINKHGANSLSVIRNIAPDEDIVLCEIGSSPTNAEIMNVLRFIQANGVKDSIIYIAWAVNKNEEIDDMISELSADYEIIVAAGNQSQPLGNWTPCSNPDVIVIGSYNKQMIPASHNNVGYIDAYAPGTNISIAGRKVSGSSIAGAIFTGYYSLNKDIEIAQETIERDFDHLITYKFA